MRFIYKISRSPPTLQETWREIVPQTRHSKQLGFNYKLKFCNKQAFYCLVLNIFSTVNFYLFQKIDYNNKNI